MQISNSFVLKMNTGNISLKSKPGISLKNVCLAAFYEYICILLLHPLWSSQPALIAWHQRSTILFLALIKINRTRSQVQCAHSTGFIFASTHPLFPLGTQWQLIHHGNVQKSHIYRPPIFPPFGRNFNLLRDYLEIHVHDTFSVFDLRRWIFITYLLCAGYETKSN